MPRSESLESYYEQGTHASPHIVTAIRLPVIELPSAAAFERVARTSFDFAILNVACRVDGSAESTKSARVIVGATPRTAQRSHGAEAHLVANGVSDASIDQAAAIARDETWVGGGWVASAEYRAHLVEVLTRRCLRTARERLT